jgi:7,8-dihydro-6-hydroxymethylpterin-pyrophosphokinase
MEDLVVTEDGPDALVLPHPRMHLRRFVLEPLNEVWPRWVHPVLGQRVEELLINCTDTSVPVRVEPVVGGMETLA